MIWNTTIEPKSEIDSGMMPPPLSLPLGRRSSSSTDQLSPPILNTLKAELMDETSQNSESSFHSNENSMDSTALYATTSGQNMEIIDENSMIVGNNFMLQQQQQQIVPTTSEVIDLRVQQEQQRQQLYSEQNYLSNLESNVQQLKLQVEANLFSQQLATTPSQQQTNFNVTEISSDSPNGGHHSPLSQDIILNSQSVVVSLQNEVLASQQQQQQGINMSSEIILNSAVSPSMMCQTSPDPMLNTMTPMNQQSQETILNTMLPSVVLHKQPSVAVKNMILNAAAEILTSQQTQTPITTGGPMNELISSLTPITTNMLAEQSQNMIMTQAPSNAQNDILCQHQQSQQMEQQMVNAIFSNTNVLPNMMSEVPVASTMMSNAGMTNLINQEIRNAVNEELQIRRAQVEYLQAVRDDQMNGEIRLVVFFFTLNSLGGFFLSILEITGLGRESE